MSHILKKFPLDPVRPAVERGEGIYIHTRDGRKILDTTAGWTSYAVLGYSHPDVLAAMRSQMEKFCHIDYNIWSNPVLEKLAELLLSQAPAGLNRVYYAGNGGSEAIEAALKLSYQMHHDAGKKSKTWYISRDQSFHGATLHGVAVSELPILTFFDNIAPSNRARISQHNPYLNRLPGESLEDYALRSANELEQKILEIGPENVCAFIGETQLGSLVGDVPAAPNYWKRIRAICDKHDVHLVLDEVYCGLGRSGKIYNISWDDVRPDFICVGKNLASGYAPLSAVITDDRLESVIMSPTGQKRIQHGHTHQGYSLGAAASLAVQRIVHSPAMLEHINMLGEHWRSTLEAELGKHPFFRNIRGRGLLFSLEYDCENKNGFGTRLARVLEDEDGILINAKWHRVSFTPSYIFTRQQVDLVLDRFIGQFKKIGKDWRG